MTEEIIKSIATQGVLGAFLALTLITIFFLYKEVKKEKEARIEDLKSIIETNVKYHIESRSMLNTILELLRGRK